jgi:O-antigen/teichoic acid export membrane protein
VPSLARNIAFTVGGTAFFHACQLAVFSLLARYTEPAVFGHYQYCLAVALPVILFCGLELRGALVSDVAGQHAPRTYFRLRAIMLTGGGLLLVVIGLLRAQSEIEWAFLFTFLAVCGARIAWSLGEVGWAMFQRREQHHWLGLANVLRGLAYLTPFAVLLPLGVGAGAGGYAPAGYVTLACVLNLIGWLAVWRWFDAARLGDWTRSGGGAAQDRLGPLFRETLPLGLTQLLIVLGDTIPRLILEAQPDGRTQLAYFGALAYLTQVGNLFIIQIGAAAANRLALYFQTDRSRFLRLLLRLNGLAIVIGILVFAAAVFYGRFFLRVLYGSEYRAFHYEFVIVVASQGLALLTAIFGITITQMRRFLIQAPLQLVILLATTAAGLLLIPADPVRGAAWTMVVRAVVHFVLYAAVLVWVLRATRVPQTSPAQRSAPPAAADEPPPPV